MKKMKHFVATILSLSMVLASSLTAFAAPQAEAVVTDQAVVSQISAESSIQAIAGKRYVKGEGIRLRSDPGTSSTVLGLLYEDEGDWVVLSGEKKVKDGYTWLKVTNSSIAGEIGRKDGWIASIYVYQ